ncbi:hypothetical protein Hanom_Chr14g01270001 [Helianthus anomalus]
MSFVYLGLPIMANMKRIKYWEPVIRKFCSKLNGWKSKTLSFTGRVTLTKAVLRSLSSYFLGIFKAPKVVLKTLEGIRRSFVWGQVRNKNKLCWIRWRKLARPKGMGGVGIGGWIDSIWRWWRNGGEGFMKNRLSFGHKLLQLYVVQTKEIN